MRRAFTLQLEYLGELHVHGCPHCHEMWECRDCCTTEPDLQDANDTRPVGCYELCDDCEWTRCPSCQANCTDGGRDCQDLHLLDHWKPADDFDPTAPARWCDACGHMWNVTPPRLIRTTDLSTTRSD